LKSTLKHTNRVLLVLLALIYLMPNFNTNESAISGVMKQTSQDCFASDVEEKEFVDTEYNLHSNYTIEYPCCNYAALNFKNHQVPLKPIIKQPTPPPQA